MSPALRFLLASALLAHGACATDSAVPQADDKDQYRDSGGKTDSGLDVCEMFDWVLSSTAWIDDS